MIFPHSLYFSFGNVLRRGISRYTTPSLVFFSVPAGGGGGLEAAYNSSLD